MAPTLSRDESAVSGWVLFVVLVIVVAAALGAYYYYTTPGPTEATIYAQQGDSVQIDYVGYFPEDGLVFDTSQRSVAVDNASYPKAFSFAWHSSWTTRPFTVGDGKVVKGFDEGVRGLAEGQSKTIYVPYSLGYGASDPAKIFVHTLVETVPVRVTMNETAFSEYYRTSPVSGSQVTDPIYGWPVLVEDLNGVVTITNSPLPGQTLHPYGVSLWSGTVLSIDDTAASGAGEITIRNVLDPSLVDVLGGTAPNGQRFYLSAVDTSAGTYTLNFNGQVVGRTLAFDITMVQITRLV